jgi:hypothetical protein
MTSLRDEDKAYAVHRLLSLMADLADSGGSGSHVQMTVKMVVPESDKDKIIERATEAGAQQATSTEL